MYNVMLVDDDVDVCEHLKTIIDWDRLELSLACEAKDGNSALELYQTYRPKIAIIDICMPGITGIELAEKMCKQDPELRIILITGFTDFEYAKEAVSMGAVKLLSKPLVPKEVNDSLQIAVKYFKDRRKQYQKSAAIQNLVKDNIKILRERKLAYLMKGEPVESEWALKEQMRLLGFMISDTHYSVIIIRFKPTQGNRGNEETHPVVVRKIVEMRLSKNGHKCNSFFDGHYRLICLVSSMDEESNEFLEETLNLLSDEIYFYFELRFMTGIGETVNRLRDIYLSAKQALASLKYFGSLNDGNVMNYKNIKNAVRSVEDLYSNNHNMLKEISPFLHARDYEGIVLMFEKWCSGDTVVSFPDMRDFSLAYISLVTEECYNAGIRMSDQLNYSDNMKHVFSADRLNELKTSLLCLTENTLSFMNQKLIKDKKELNHMVYLAKQFIKDNLTSKELNLELVSDHIALSKNYFGRLFLRGENISVNAYINKERIEYAKKLLIETSDKIYEIGDNVGYSSAKGFSYAFKAYTGMSPYEYRKNTNMLG